MQGVSSTGGGYSRTVVVDDSLMAPTRDSELGHSGRSVAAVHPSSLDPPPPPYSELFPDSLPSYWEATGEGRHVKRLTMTQLANIRAVGAGRYDPILVGPLEPAHRRVECLDACCRCSLEGLARNWPLLLLCPTLCLLVCVLIVILVEIYTASDP